MNTLSQSQCLAIKEHMLDELDALKIKYKARNTEFATVSVFLSEIDDYADNGYFEKSRTARKAKMQKPKEHGVQFEDDVWCMFYNLGFRILNADEKLKVQWGPNPSDTQQLDVVAVGEDAIFVVECKAAKEFRSASFKVELNKIEQYKEGVARALQQIYGKEKRVKFIFATRNFRFAEDSEDLKRMKNMDIFHLNDNSYNYIKNLIKSYKESVIYQFYALMFKDELINDNRIKIPVLRGKMGKHNYYIFSIEPNTLLKIGFVLHRTRVNDSMAPTYQRLLVPSRLKGITKFIDEDNGYFPNSIIINFAASEKSNLNIEFEPIETKDVNSQSEFGILHLPNAYGIAYIIDGQHRVYGYAQSKKKDQNTIPVVAFENMSSEEQLKIFMEINENQKSVSPSLRLDLEEDLYWSSLRLDSRIKALRSSIIKVLSGDSNNILYNKISVGEDPAKLAFKPFSTALIQSGLLPKATQTKWVGDWDTCIFDLSETDIDKAMKESRKRIVQYINACYELAYEYMNDETREYFLFSNRATYAFITTIGSLHKHLILDGKIVKYSTLSDKREAIRPYIKTLAEKLNSLPEDKKSKIKTWLGQGADVHWQRSYQDLINSVHSNYEPEGLSQWKETQDQTLQQEGADKKESIRKQLRTLVVSRLKQVYGSEWIIQTKIAKIKHEVEGRILDEYGESPNFNMGDYDWIEHIKVNEFREIIENNFTNEKFNEVFSINIGQGVKTKKEQLAWMTYIIDAKGKKAAALTRQDINRLDLINGHLAQFEE
ncbi:MAG: DGQHR domain-containing protein [Paludibacteraceae bacterium]|nr:DGQHR domain-containing protein [Paludibacteraceae bacterium]